MAIMREFRAQDIDAVKELVDSTIDVSYAGVYPPAAIAFFKAHHAVEKILADGRNGCILVAEDEGRMIGTGTLVNDEVGRMFVMPECQGLGIGRDILGRLEQVAREKGLRHLRLDASLVARAFYERMGFKLVKDKARPVGNNERMEYSVMTKAL
jgi:GNAT superfamily N-acetyltransferase